jgi:hypothetical protein
MSACIVKPVFAQSLFLYPAGGAPPLRAGTITGPLHCHLFSRGSERWFKGKVGEDTPEMCCRLEKHRPAPGRPMIGFRYLPDPAAHEIAVMKFLNREEVRRFADETLGL